MIFFFERLSPDDGIWKVYFSDMSECAIVSFDESEPVVKMEKCAHPLEQLETLTAGINRLQRDPALRSRESFHFGNKVR